MIRGSDNSYIVWCRRLLLYHIATISGIRTLGIVGFYDIIWAIQGLISNKLYLNGAITEPFNGKNCHILKFIAVQSNTQHDIVDSAFNKIMNHDVINKVIAIQVEVVDHYFRIIKAFFKGFQCFRLLKQIHDSEQIQVVTW